MGRAWEYGTKGGRCEIPENAGEIFAPSINRFWSLEILLAIKCTVCSSISTIEQ
jgi:hypothetical protein